MGLGNGRKLIGGAGLALGCILFDALFFMPVMNNLLEKKDVYRIYCQNSFYAYFAVISLIFNAIGATLGLLVLSRVKKRCFWVRLRNFFF